MYSGANGSSNTHLLYPGVSAEEERIAWWRHPIDKCPQAVYTVICWQGNTLPIIACECYNGETQKSKGTSLIKRREWAQEDGAWGIGISLSTVQCWDKKGGEPTRLARRELQKLFKEAGIGGEES